MHCSVCGGTRHRKNKCPNSTPRDETCKSKKKACTSGRTKSTLTRESEPKTTPDQRKKLEIRRKPTLHTQTSVFSCMTTNRSMDVGKGSESTTRDENAENFTQDF